MFLSLTKIVLRILVTNRSVMFLVVFLALISSIPAMLFMGASAVESNLKIYAKMTSEYDGHMETYGIKCELGYYSTVKITTDENVLKTNVMIVLSNSSLILIDPILAKSLNITNKTLIKICADQTNICQEALAIIPSTSKFIKYPLIFYSRNMDLYKPERVRLCSYSHRNPSRLLELIAEEVTRNISELEVPLTLALIPTYVSAGFLASRNISRELAVINSIGVPSSTFILSLVITLLIIAPLYLLEAASVSILVFHTTMWIVGYITGTMMILPGSASWSPSIQWILILYGFFLTSLLIGSRRM